MLSGKLIACDTETTGLHPWLGDRPFVISFCNEKYETACVEWSVDPLTRKVLIRSREWEAVRRLLEDETVTKVFHYASFDVRMSEAIRIHVAGPGGPVASGGRLEETMYLAHCLNSLEPSLGLKPLCLKYLDMDDDDQKDLKKAVVRLRRRAKKNGWQIGTELQYEDEYVERKHKKGAVERDYWLPRAFERLDHEALKPREASLCRKYALRDAERTMALYQLLRQLVEERGNLEAYERELELWSVTYRMESRGVRVHRTALRKKIRYVRSEIARWKPKVESCAWDGFNIDSPPHLRRLLFQDLKIPPKSWTEKTRVPKVNEQALDQYVDYPAVKALLRYRSAKKALTSFFGRYKMLMVRDRLTDMGTSVLHPRFNQVGPATGRYSCRDPNLQNVASRQTGQSATLVEARDVMCPRPGYAWFHFDYSQLEIRIFAFSAQEEVMLGLLSQGGDIADACANKAWGGAGNPHSVFPALHSLMLTGASGKPTPQVLKTWKDLGLNTKRAQRMSRASRKAVAADWLARFDWSITKAEASLSVSHSRTRAKMIFYSRLYGGGVGVVQVLVRCSASDAEQFIRGYDEGFPRMSVFISEVTREARKTGCIETLWGRTLSVNREKSYRAVNYHIQGSAAELLKVAMIRCQAYLDEIGIDAHMVITLHDELVFEIRKSHAGVGVIVHLARIMQDARDDKIGCATPVKVERSDRCWSEKRELPRYKELLS